jgi:hypothetical protein
MVRRWQRVEQRMQLFRAIPGQVNDDVEAAAAQRQGHRLRVIAVGDEGFRRKAGWYRGQPAVEPSEPVAPGSNRLAEVQAEEPGTA